MGEADRTVCNFCHKLEFFLIVFLALDNKIIKAQIILFFIDKFLRIDIQQIAKNQIIL
jgi:hypothetical protein